MESTIALLRQYIIHGAKESIKYHDSPNDIRQTFRSEI